MTSKMESYESQGLLHEMFVRQARRTPDKKAVISPAGREVTFRQLDEWTDALAENFRHRGVVPDRCVAIYMDKTIEFVVAYIAILKSGGAYLPIDTSYPTHLVQTILQDARPVAIAASPEFSQKLEGVSNVLELSEGWLERVQEENRRHCDPAVTPTLSHDNLAYIVYSSGTTGKPKGIMCPHRGAVFSYHWRHVQYPYTEDDREACNIFFVWELMRPLLKGVPMFIIPNTVIYDPPLLCKFIHDNRITRILFTPSLLETILNTQNIDLSEAFASLKQIWFCGEVVTTVLLGRCIKLLPWIQFVNLYSISECHDTACEDLSAYYHRQKESLMSRKFCPVGTLLPGVKVVILNEDHYCQPVGVSGEIFVGGPTLARGYLNRPDLQALRFIQRPDSVPESHGDRLYRTGDWGYVLSDGSLEICGRCDSMVKIRGYSIEVQAVESNLLVLPMVHACVVLVMGEEGENKFLVSYIVPEGDTSKKEVRAALKRRLPFYMIPSFFVFLKTIPVLEASGKLDKKALPPFDQQSLNDVDGAPTTETEVKLASVWADILQIKDIDIQESFFDLGGHSLLAAQLLNKIREDYDMNISVYDLFTYPTVYSLGKVIDARLQKANTQTDFDEDTISRVVKESDLKPSLDLQAEVDRHDQGVVNLDIQLRAFWRTFHHGHHFHTGRVLLTGATGFLGAFLLKELILSTKLLVYCLVRETPHLSEIERVKQSLRQFGIMPSQTDKPTDEQQTMEQELTKRVTPIKGNIGLMNMGMNEDDYTYLCTDIDFIIHAAASVNLAYPYSALHGPNVLGTANIVLFASTGKVKPIHYISTDAVFPNGKKYCSEEEDISGYHDKLQDGYSQSKWVAERLVQRASNRGLPVTIYRLGNMAGDRQNAFWNPQDLTLLILQACAKHGIAPDVDWDVEMTPVDFAAHVIVRLTQDRPTAMRKIFHIINTKPLKSRWIFEWMFAHGYPIEFLPFREWRQKVLESGKLSNGNSGAMIQLLESYIRDESFFSSLSSYRNENLLNVLSVLGLEYAYIDSTLLKTYFTKLSARKVITKILTRSFSTDNLPLHGKVAIVTGASGGIGSAIARALARNGAKVAMAARRVDRMKDVEQEVKAEGGVAIPVKTDVLSKNDVVELVRHTETTLGPVDIIVNNAGVMYFNLMKNVNVEQWDTQIDVNCKGVTNCIGAVLPGMLSRGQGHIVNMSSDAGKMGFPGLAVYSGTKFFIEGMSQALRLEVKGSGVKVTCIQPGNVNTDLFTLSTDDEAKEKYDESSTAKILEPTDIANAVVYALTQPDYVAINNILIEPRDQPI